MRTSPSSMKYAASPSSPSVKMVVPGSNSTSVSSFRDRFPVLVGETVEESGQAHRNVAS